MLSVHVVGRSMPHLKLKEERQSMLAPRQESNSLTSWMPHGKFHGYWDCSIRVLPFPGKNCRELMRGDTDTSFPVQHVQTITPHMHMF
jgi:hypothetical protein